MSELREMYETAAVLGASTRDVYKRLYSAVQAPIDVRANAQARFSLEAMAGVENAGLDDSTWQALQAVRPRRHG